MPWKGRSGPAQIATVTPDVLLLNDVSGPLAFDQFAAMGATAPADPDRVVLVADHFAPASDINSATSIKSLRSFARTHGIKRFYEPGRGGIEHTLLDELGLVGHGTIVFGADSHTCTAGAFNALGIGFGSTDLAAVLATGRLWLRVPASIRVELSGRPGAYVTGKDVILEVIRRIGVDGAADAALEFGGPGLGGLSMEDRMAVANMAVEAGADTCAFEGDVLSAAHMALRGRDDCPPVAPDAERRISGPDRYRPCATEPAGGAAALAGLRGAGRHPGGRARRPGLRRQLRQRHHGRPAAGCEHSARPHDCAARAHDRRSRDTADLARRPRRGDPRCHHRGRRDRFTPHLRGVLRRSHGHSRRRRNGDCDHQPQLSGAAWVTPTSRVFLANSWVAAAAAVAGEIVPPGRFADGDGNSR